MINFFLTGYQIHSVLVQMSVLTFFGLFSYLSFFFNFISLVFFSFQADFCYVVNIKQGVTFHVFGYKVG